MLRINCSAPLLSCPSAWQLLRDVPAVKEFLFDKATISGTQHKGYSIVHRYSFCIFIYLFESTYCKISRIKLIIRKIIVQIIKYFHVCYFFSCCQYPRLGLIICLMSTFLLRFTCYSDYLIFDVHKCLHCHKYLLIWISLICVLYSIVPVVLC
jgi:hypothetical protein